MKRLIKTVRSGIVLALLAGLTPFALGSGPALADGDAPKSIVEGLMNQPLGDLEGRTVKIVSVTYPPGGASKPHRHPAHVFVYVVEGTVVAQLEGGEKTAYEVGQSWYEPPMVTHLISANASKTEPARVIAFILIEDGKPVVLPE